MWTTNLYDEICTEGFVESCKAFALIKQPDGSPTGGTFFPSPPMFFSTVGTPQGGQCMCDSPFRAFLYFNTTAFRSFNKKKAEIVRAETVNDLNAAGVRIDVNQVSAIRGGNLCALLLPF